ncbi:MAG: glycosyltransferase family 4 protein [Candidatus Pacebacteria bacterium]|nr:glycosyltransferase family 4 protein [Candidatus Paceibacterota bacterium]
MRILIFSTDDHMYPAGGAEHAMGEITKRLPHIEFDLICARLRKGAPRCEKVKNVNIYRIGFGIPKLDGILLTFLGCRKALGLSKKRKYDLVWSVMATYGAFSAVRVKRKLNLPFFLTLQEGDPIEHILHKVRFVRSRFDEIFTEANGLQAISTYLFKWAEDMGFKGNVKRVVPNGVDVSNFTQEFDKNEIKQLRDSFEFPEDAFILLTSSRLEVKNGVGDVVQALSLMPKDVCFVICGTGSLEDAIRKQVEDLGLKKRVRFMGFVKHDMLPKLLNASDAFIRPSLTEGLGNSFLEGMATKRPVIATLVGGIPDFLFDGETGFACKPEDPESIVRSVKRIKRLSDRERDEILIRAYNMVIETYNWDVISKQMEGLFKETILSV